ncbi:glycosyltransferase family 4 protein [Nitrosopumilus sp.]|uniref:glycosyltransferase family 4 protein n=1 Tax=Nitrosopumilus sp. TaxID=2024843 RepID=UPI003D12D321
MKIALVCPASLPATQFGGILFLAVDLAREISKLNHNVTIYTTDMDFANNPKTFNKHLPRCESVEKIFIKRTHVLFSYGLFFINPKMYNQLKNDKSDIIHSIGIRSFQSFIAAIVSKNKKIPLVLSDQGGLTTHPDLKKNGIIKKIFYKLQKPMINFVINQASKIIVANKYEQRIFEELNAEHKTIIIKNGINLDDFREIKNDFREKYSINEQFILFVGRFNKVKGVDVLIQAFDLIKNEPEIAELKLVIMGVDFGYEKNMFKMIKDMKLEQKIVVIKNPARKDVIAAYSESEFLVLPSRWELSPLTPLEGFAFKKTVISTNVHGIPSTITNNEHGILTKTNEPKELAESILKLVKNPDLRTKLGLSGFKLVSEECNSESMAKNTLAVYNELISE